MWIAKIELFNFKSYQHQIFEFPQPKGGRNIVLIGGMNGYGKTSILEALYLGLYGKEAVEHLGRAGLKDYIGYRKFVTQALHGTAVRTGRFSMWVKAQINKTPAEGWEITRTWFFSRSGDWTGEEEVVIYPVRDGIRGHALIAEKLPELLDQDFIPAHVAPFFFFDGEEVKKLADQGRSDQIKSGIEGLLGVVLLRRLKKRLEEFQTHRSSGIPALDEQKHRELFEALSKHELEYEELERKHREVDEAVRSLQTQRTDLTNRMIGLGAGAGDVASAADIVRQQTEAENELRVTEDALDEIVATKLPFHLVGRETLEALSQQIRAEISRESWEERRRNLEPEKSMFLNTFYKTNEPPLEPSLTGDQEASLRARLDTAWESLFYPMPQGCAETMMHDYLGSKHLTLLNAMDGLRMGAEDVLGLIAKREALQKRIRELVNRYTKIEGVDRDGTLAKLQGEAASISAMLDQKQPELGDLGRQMVALKSTIDQERALYAREHERFVQANPVKSMVARAERVCNLIAELIPQMYALKVNQLAKAMTSVYKNLAHKGQIHRVDIDETGKTRILARNGQEIPFDKSAGENQVFATALLAGLAEISGIDAPMVVDTPLGRLDSTHRTNILKYWVSNKKRQVILLSQDKEIDQGTYAALEAHVGKTYLLQHAEIESGVGRTVAAEGRYFEEATV
ncbi:DNA sulfur modification protein DndD [Nitrosospira sp. Nsp2]|uniref:DNA sulfur modification protein DndD n=1 Tax=Nitrosospira sp. Nsp2 TaxID=136548 RepID=UPI000D3265AD|nr:DNA sulfur modification protein DndD [Nitrosospira sp. Nsp2]PTR16999.1 DNA sulfur modification protein DndD [Nitrosospira sp. Nsp2]